MRAVPTRNTLCLNLTAWARRRELRMCWIAIVRGAFAHPTKACASLRDDFDFSVNAVDDPEGAFVGLVVIAGNGAIFAFGQDDAREGADGFLDHVASRREHRPLRVGARLAAALVHQLERNDRRAMIDGGIGKL